MVQKTEELSAATEISRVTSPVLQLICEEHLAHRNSAIGPSAQTDAEFTALDVQEPRGCFAHEEAEGVPRCALLSAAGVEGDLGRNPYWGNEKDVGHFNSSESNALDSVKVGIWQA